MLKSSYFINMCVLLIYLFCIQMYCITLDDYMHTYTQIYMKCKLFFSLRGKIMNIVCVLLICVFQLLFIDLYYSGNKVLNLKSLK